MNSSKENDCARSKARKGSRRITRYAQITLLCCAALLATAAASREASPSLDKLTKAAESGDGKAMLRLGNAYFFGRNGAEINYDLAFKWYEKAADAGNAAALFNLGLCYEGGRGTPKDVLKAFECYKDAADVGVPQAKFNLALLYAKGVRGGEEDATATPRDAVLAEKLLSELCADNFVPAFRELGRLLLRSGDPAKRSKARPLLEKAASFGDPMAMNLLSDFFASSSGDKNKNAKTAVKWLEKAAMAGSVEAIAKLAYRYENGEGVDKDPAKAFEHYKMAARAGLPMAQAKLGDYYAFGGAGVERNIPEAKKWYARAALSKNAKALFYLGTFAMEGIGEKKDLEKAAKLFILAARYGEPHAQYNLAKFHMKGEGVSKDPAMAVYWFRQAAARGDAKAQRELAFCLLRGKGVKENYREGVKWLRKAAENGDAQAIKFMRDTGL